MITGTLAEETSIPAHILIQDQSMEIKSNLPISPVWNSSTWSSNLIYCISSFSTKSFLIFEKSDTLNIKIKLINKKAHYKSSRVEKIEQFFLVWFVSNVGGKGNGCIKITSSKGFWFEAVNIGFMLPDPKQLELESTVVIKVSKVLFIFDLSSARSSLMIPVWTIL